MNGKKLLALLLAVLMLASTLLLVACGDDPDPKPGPDTQDTSGQKDTGDTGDTADSGTETDPSERLYLDDLDEKYDFGGQTIMFYSEKGAEYIVDMDTYLASDVTEKAKYTRQTQVEERMNVVFDGIFDLSYSGYNGPVTTDASSGANDYDILIGHMKFQTGLCLTDSVLNLNKLPGIDFSKDYWNKKYTENFTYKGLTYWSTGDLTTSFISELMGLFVDDEVFAKYYPDVDLFEMVDNGTWTMEKATEFSSVVWEDLNGDTEKNAGDLYGWISQNGWSISSLAYAGGFKLTEPASGGKWKINLVTEENEAIYAAYKKMTKDNPCFTKNTTIDPLRERQCMFTHDTLGAMGGYRDLTFEYSVIPLPKFRETDDYVTPSYDGVPVIGVCASLRAYPERYEAVGVTMEALAAAGKKYLTEAYFEVSLRSKYAKNAGSYRSLAIIREKAWSDFAFCWCQPIDGIDCFPDEAVMGGAATVAASAAINERGYQTALTQLYAKFKEQADRES